MAVARSSIIAPSPVWTAWRKLSSMFQHFNGRWAAGARGVGSAEGRTLGRCSRRNSLRGGGAGIPRRTLARFLPAWNFSGIYDGVLTGLLGGADPHAGPALRCLAPCRPRVRLVPNRGLHGESEQRFHAPPPSALCSPGLRVRRVRESGSGPGGTTLCRWVAKGARGRPRGRMPPSRMCQAPIASLRWSVQRPRARGGKRARGREAPATVQAASALWRRCPRW